MEVIILQKIQGPEQLKDLTTEELNILAQEIREEIIACVSKNGGHLASSLGVVELTIALHRVFNSPQDKLIWDVGHQTYAHKLLTGRRKEFTTLRQFKGLSGFPKRKESPHDIFETGHSSTSISAAVGLALARDLKKEEGQVIAIIGDGALTGGMALEALNHAGNLGLNLIVVLNDNEMSIDHNTGALASYLSNLRTAPRYYQRKEELEKFLRRLPHGEHLVKLAERFKESLKYLLVPGMLFEELGFTYLGPVNGHNIAELENFLKLASRTKGPVLVHVLTVKGKGYPPAEKEPAKYHGLSPSSLTSSSAPKISYSDVFGQTLCELARRDEKIVAITAAMTQGTGLGSFAREFPHRLFDVGIAEEHAVTMAAGMAAGGLKPVVAIYSTFLQRAFDQLIHDVALQNLPVILAIDRAGIVGEDGETHQGLYDLSYLRLIPNMVIMAPRDEIELQRMLCTALELNKPVAIRYPKGSIRGISSLKEVKPFSKLEGEVLREGKDLAFLTEGPLAYEALAAASALEKYGIEAEVVDLRFVKPLDRKLLQKVVQNTKNLVIAEENTLLGGLGSAVLEFLVEEGIEAKVARVGAPDVFIEQGKADILRQKYGLNRDGLLRSACDLISFELPLRQGSIYE